MESLCNHFLLQFLRLQSEPVQRCFRHIEALQWLWYRGKHILFFFFFFFYKIMAFSNLGIIQVLTSTWWQGCIINFFNRFLATDLKLRIAITDELKMCSCYFEEKWGRGRRRGQQGTCPARGHHLCLTDTISYIYNNFCDNWRNTFKIMAMLLINNYVCPPSVL